jgi:hypothetical protein
LHYRASLSTVAPPRLELGKQDLIRAHTHAIWLVVIDLNLKASMTELLDVELPGQSLYDDVTSKFTDSAATSRAAAAVRAVLLATPEVTSAPWWREDWRDDTINGAPRRFELALQRWRVSTPKP